ncbi:hypothetical protein P7C73_g3752, partial [Tremellales sp. Uapishka_1]
MASDMDPEVILYDLACTENVCFSPVVWRIRLLLNYKRIPYRTVFLEFPDIAPTLEGLGIPLGSSPKYTVPAIHHLPTDTFTMDSTPISELIESLYPDPPVKLTSKLGNELLLQARAALGPISRSLAMPREIRILSPRAGEFFRSTREAALGHRLEDLLDEDKEAQVWTAADDDIRAVGHLLSTHRGEGPFILGAQPSYADFALAGALQSMRVIDEAMFGRIMRYPGFAEFFDACVPYMQKKN